MKVLILIGLLAIQPTFAQSPDSKDPKEIKAEAISQLGELAAKTGPRPETVKKDVQARSKKVAGLEQEITQLRTRERFLHLELNHIPARYPEKALQERALDECQHQIRIVQGEIKVKEERLAQERQDLAQAEFNLDLMNVSQDLAKSDQLEEWRRKAEELKVTRLEKVKELLPPLPETR